MKNPNTMFLAKLIVVLLWPGLVVAQSEYQQQMLDNQQQLLRIQQQQLNIAQTVENERTLESMRIRRQDSEKIWADFYALPKKDQKEIIDDWNKDRPDCPFPCPSGKPKR